MIKGLCSLYSRNRALSRFAAIQSSLLYFEKASLIVAWEIAGCLIPKRQNFDGVRELAACGAVLRSSRPTRTS